MSRPKKCKRVPGMRSSAATVYALPTATEHADPAVRLGLKIRADASLSGCCACGGKAEHYVLVDEEEGVLLRVDERSTTPGSVTYVEILHKDDCPAVHPRVLAAVAASTPKKEGHHGNEDA